jgi:hypothetical protein
VSSGMSVIVVLSPKEIRCNPLKVPTKSPPIHATLALRPTTQYTRLDTTGGGVA